MTALWWILIGVISLVGWIMNSKLQSVFKKYSKKPIQSGKTGAEIARDMLDHFGVGDVKIVQGKGFLTDHYNPASKTVSLSPSIYNGRSVAAAAVAAHECGHAVQHAEAYSWLQMRSALVPAVKVASVAQQYLFLIALFLLSSIPWLMTAVLISFVITTAFSFITLPVEFDASNRALKWLKTSSTAEGVEFEGAKTSLHWAAMTYVSAALSSLAMLLFVFLMNRN